VATAVRKCIKGAQQGAAVTHAMCTRHAVCTQALDNAVCTQALDNAVCTQALDTRSCSHALQPFHPSA